MLLMLLIVVMGMSYGYALNPNSEIVINKYNQIYCMQYIDTPNIYPLTPEQFYNLGGGDCEDKVIAFADFLYKHGERNLWIIFIPIENQNQGHAVCEWNNHIYDLTIQGAYDLTWNQYQGFLSYKIGSYWWVPSKYYPNFAKDLINYWNSPAN
jgi:hypothetical protein